MKAVLISIKPQWAKLIAEGKKTVEVRKTKPKLDVPFKCYIYCTDAKGQAFFTKGENGNYAPARMGNRKIIGEFICDEIYHIKNYDTRFSINNDERLTNGVARASCLNFDDMKNYLKDKDGYAWHITDLVIYDKPKELSEFQPVCKYNMDSECVYWDDCKHKAITTDWGYAANMCNKKITRPPQSWAYCELGV